MRKLAPPPDNPFNDRDPESILGRAIRWPFRVVVIGLSILAAALYFLFASDDS